MVDFVVIVAPESIPPWPKDHPARAGVQPISQRFVVARLHHEVQRVVHQAHALEKGDVFGDAVVDFVYGFLREVYDSSAAVDLLMDDCLVHDGKVHIFQDSFADRQLHAVLRGVFVLARQTPNGGLAGLGRAAEARQFLLIIGLYSQQLTLGK